MESNTEKTSLSAHIDSDQQINRKLHLLLRTGVMLMERSADTSRVMRNLKRTAGYLGLEEKQLQMNVEYDTLMASYGDSEHSVSRIMQTKPHIIDMAAISQISHLTWNAIRYNYSLDRYESKLDKIERQKHYYSQWLIALGAGFACGGFCIQFGCDWPAFFYASIAATLGMRLKMQLGRYRVNDYISIGIATFVATLMAWLESLLSALPAISSHLPGFMISATPYHPLMACALFIIPGVPIINCVSDMLAGHIRTGLSRAINTLLMVSAMAFGIAFAIRICGISNFVTNLNMVPHHNYVEYALAAAISAMGFSTIYNTPRRLLPVIALGGIIAVCIRNFVNLGPSTNNIGLDQGIIVGTLAGSTILSLVMAALIHRFHTPHQVLSIPSVIPMVPGVLMYRALFAFIEMRGVIGEVTTAMHNLILATLVILCIAIGVAIPNLFVRNMLESRRKIKFYRLLIERRRKPHHNEP